MDIEKTVAAFWSEIDAQAWEKLPTYFCPDAEIQWPNTNESFRVEQYVKANTDYPGNWSVTLERLETIGCLAVSVAQVTLAGGEVAFHAVSFFEFTEGRIVRLTEYWGDDGEPPEWRKGLARPIHTN